MDTGKRRWILNSIKSKLNSLGWFQQVEGSLPDSAMPNALTMPAAFFARGVERIAYSTNQERTSSFPFSIVVFIEAASDIELEKCDAQDIVEEALVELFVSADWRNRNLMLTVETVDASSFAVAPLGLEGGTFPPYGAIRMDCVATFDYNASS